MRKSMWQTKWVISVYDSDSNPVAHMCSCSLLHKEGAEYMLRRCLSDSPPMLLSDLCIGLDSRFTVTTLDTLKDIDSEPTTGGYSRKQISLVDLNFVQDDGAYIAELPTQVFVNQGKEDWVLYNVFVAATQDDVGILLSSKELPGLLPVVIPTGGRVSIQLSMLIAD